MTKESKALLFKNVMLYDLIIHIAMVSFLVYLMRLDLSEFYKYTNIFLPAILITYSIRLIERVHNAIISYRQRLLRNKIDGEKFNLIWRTIGFLFVSFCAYFSNKAAPDAAAVFMLFAAGPVIFCLIQLKSIVKKIKNEYKYYFNETINKEPFAHLLSKNRLQIRSNKENVYDIYIDNNVKIKSDFVRVRPSFRMLGQTITSVSSQSKMVYELYFKNKKYNVLSVIKYLEESNGVFESLTDDDMLIIEMLSIE